VHKTIIINKKIVMTKIKNDSTVKVNYTGKLENGDIFDSSTFDGRTPLEVKLGEGKLIPGFENGLIDMGIGETKTIEINPEQAYGDVNKDAIHEIAKKDVPEGVKVNDTLQANGPNGAVANVTVTEVKENTVVLDANHPLAGKKLIFELEVLDIT
jgi:FKBP-type peptidyl-prolyl cis-trans isomerase SlpA